MKLEYDAAADAAYIYLANNVATGDVESTYTCDTSQVDGMINLDFNEKGVLIGIEILDATHKLPLEVLQPQDQ